MSHPRLAAAWPDDDPLDEDEEMSVVLAVARVLRSCPPGPVELPALAAAVSEDALALAAMTRLVDDEDLREAAALARLSARALSLAALPGPL